MAVQSEPLSYAYAINPNTGKPAYVYAGSGGFNGPGLQEISFQEAQQAVKDGLSYMPGGNMTNAQFLALEAPSDSGNVASWTNPNTGEVLTNVPQTTIDSIMGQNASSPKTLGDVTGGSSSPSNTPQFPTTALQPGSTNTAAVKQLQDYLVSQGYMTQAQVNTGYGTYGPQTTAAVQALQQKLGVNNSSGPGYWGPQTLAAVQAQGGSTGTGGTTGSGATGTGTGGTGGTGTGSGTGGGTSFSAVTGYQTGNAQLDAIVAGLQNYLNGLIASGQKINPNIALSPNDVQTFLNQAKSEDDPDFSRKIEAVQTATSQNLTALQTQYEAEQTKENNDFQQSLASTRDTNEEYGTMQSSARNFQELQATQTANANATLNASQAQNSAQKLASSEASQVGDENVNNLPQFQNYTYSNQGIGGATAGSNLNYFNIGNYPTGTGSIEQSQQTAEQNRAIQLGQTQLQQRALNFYGT